MGEPEHAMILIAYSFFFFLVSGVLRLWDSGDVD